DVAASSAATPAIAANVERPITPPIGGSRLPQVHVLGLSSRRQIRLPRLRNWLPPLGLSREEPLQAASTEVKYSHTEHRPTDDPPNADLGRHQLLAALGNRQKRQVRRALGERVPGGAMAPRLLGIEDHAAGEPEQSHAAKCQEGGNGRQ